MLGGGAAVGWARMELSKGKEGTKQDGGGTAAAVEVEEEEEVEVPDLMMRVLSVLSS